MTLLTKNLLKYGVFGTVIFLGLFIYFFIKSRNFRVASVSAFAALTLFLQSAWGIDKADGFQNQNLTPKPQQSRVTKSTSGVFGTNGKNLDGSSSSSPSPGGGSNGSSNPDTSSSNNGPNSNGSESNGTPQYPYIPQFPKCESVEETQQYLDNMDNLLAEMESISDDEESEIESNSNSVSTQKQKQKQGSPTQSLKTWASRNEPNSKDRFISLESRPNLVNRFGQGKFKTKKHGALMGLDYEIKSDNSTATLKTDENAEKFIDRVAQVVEDPDCVWFENGSYEASSGKVPSINIYSKYHNRVVIYTQPTQCADGEFAQFLTVVEPSGDELEDLFESNGHFGGQDGWFSKKPKNLKPKVEFKSKSSSQNSNQDDSQI